MEGFAYTIVSNDQEISTKCIAQAEEKMSEILSTALLRAATKYYFQVPHSRFWGEDSWRNYW